MRLLFLCYLLSLPLLVAAEPNRDTGALPPPDLSTTAKENVNTKTTADADAGEPQAVPEQPDLPLPVHSGENLEPDITIIRRGQETIQEFRNNGQLYMVKIIPDVGPPYYWVDTNGDGKLDVQKNDIDRGTKVNMWKLYEWK